jgi:hypothetical protein
MKTALVIVEDDRYNLCITYETKEQARLIIDALAENVLAVLWDVE